MKKIFLLSLFLFNFTHAGIPQYVTYAIKGGVITSTGLSIGVALEHYLTSSSVGAATSIGAATSLGIAATSLGIAAAVAITVAAKVAATTTATGVARVVEAQVAAGVEAGVATATAVVAGAALGLTVPTCFMYLMCFQPFVSWF